MHQEKQKSVYRPHIAALIIASVYIVFACIYILFSDLLLNAISKDIHKQLVVQMTKGLIFVLATGVALYYVLDRYFSRVQSLIESAFRSNVALKTALDRFPGPSLIIDSMEKLVYLNQYACEIANVSPEEAIGRHIHDVFSGQSTDYRKFLESCFTAGRPVSGEVKLDLSSGAVYYMTTCIPLQSRQGDINQVLALAYDISERKKSAIRVEQQKRELRQIIDLIPNLVFAKNDNGQYILANEAFSRFHGLSSEEVIGKTAGLILPEDTSLEEIQLQDIEVMEHGRAVYRACQTMVNAEGVQRFFQVTKIPFRTATDDQSALLGVAIDITEHLKNEHAINKSEDRFRALVNHSLDALFVYDSDGVIKLVNQRACDLIGKSTSELIGNSFIKILAGEVASTEIGTPPIFFAGSCFQMLLHTPGNRDIPVEIRVGPLPGDETGSFLAEARDITERLDIERERLLLSKLGITLSACRNSNEIAHALFDAIRGYLPLDAFFFAIRISGKSRFRQQLVVDTINGELQYLPTFDFSTRRDSPLKDLYEGKNVFLSRRTPEEYENLSGFGSSSRSLMYFPVMVGNKVVAVMSVQSSLPDQYTHENLELVQRIADLAGPALESARANRNGSIFAELGRQLGAAGTAADVAEIIALMADDLTGWDACAIALYSTTDDSINYIYLADSIQDERVRIEDTEGFKPPSYYTERVLRHGPFLVFKDIDTTDYLPMLVNQNGKVPLSMIWVPIPGETGPTGFLTVHHYTARAYDDEDLESIRALAEHCGAALNRTASQALLRYTEERYRLAIESTGAAAYQLDYSTMEYVFMGREIQQITGYPPEKFTTSLWEKITLESHLDPYCEVTYDQDGRRYFRQWRTEVRIRRLDGEERWLSDQAVQLHSAAGTPTGTLGIIRDITEQKRVELALRASEERYALSARGANDGLWDWDLKTDNIHFSERWSEMLGYSEETEFDSPEDWFDLIHPDDLESMKSLLQEHLLGTSKHFECEVRTRHKEGHYLWMLIRGIAVHGAEGTPTRIAGSQTDITDRIQNQERLQHDALHDPLTGLPNRAMLMEHLNRCLEHMRRRSDYRFALIFMDLDRFKTINDSLGHLMGDHVLVVTSQRLKEAVRPMDIVARFAGDEFAVILEHIEAEPDIVEVLTRIQTAVAQPINAEAHEIATSASAGVAIGSTHYSNPNEILRDADNALYKSKSDGPGRFRIFDTSMHEHAIKMLRLEADLRRAIERDQLRLAFQPIINVENGRVERFEALLRWQHPELGFLLPDNFIPMAEETGLIYDLDEWVIREACRSWKSWQKESDCFQHIKINVNLSPRHFLRHVKLTEHFTEIVRSEGLAPDLLGLELTENALLSFRDATTETLRELKRAGFSLYLDDFGKGYSSLSYLHNFPFDVVKIDRLFIMRMQDEGPELEIVNAILSLASRLHLGVVAEGVETPRQMEIVRQLGCEFAQGFYMSQPVKPEVAAGMIHEARTW